MFAETLSRSAQSALATLGKSGFLRKAYLAGGSALALHLSHRCSWDLDFFTPETFVPEEMAAQLSRLGKFTDIGFEVGTLRGSFQDTKFSLFHFDYPLLAKTHPFLDVGVADPMDISAMKLAAIVDRGTKRDFIDLYFLAKEKYSLERILEFYDRKYRSLAGNIYSLIKSLQYFEDAEGTPEPKMLKEVSWPAVKRFFQAEAVRLGKKFL